MTQALQREGSRPTQGGGNRTAAFRRSFQQAFAVRIGERLSGITEASTRQGAADDQRLLPVLAGREQAVKQFTDKLFPDIVIERAAPTYDREGWTPGTHAADLAPLTAIPALNNEHPRTPAAKASLPDRPLRPSGSKTHPHARDASRDFAPQVAGSARSSSGAGSVRRR